MRCKRTLSTFAAILLSFLAVGRLISAECPTSFRIDGVPRIKQNTNYCGPAVVASALQHLGETITQETVGEAVYDPVQRATNGADMLYYARSKGYAAYSWNSSLEDAKRKISAGAPILVLQRNSDTDASGHYRILTGYDDAQQKFYVMDPYYDEITELPYKQCEKWWKPMGCWALLIVPKDKDTFANELSARNPVVHMDMSYALYARGSYAEAQKEIKIALSLEPNSGYSRDLLAKINRAIGAGKKRG